jgi:uncharacterized protein YndB with AHSA1/START domain
MLTPMKTLDWLFCLTVLLTVTICHAQPEKAASEGLQQGEMMSVVNTVTISGAPEAVYDLVTTARFWPQWHPATMAVGGVTKRPYALGDRIFERGRIGNLNFQVVWKVAEHTRPWRVVLQAETSLARITYTLQAQDGATAFSRTLEYRLERSSLTASSAADLDRLMQVQSEQAVNQLKALVEKILREEVLGVQ